MLKELESSELESSAMIESESGQSTYNQNQYLERDKVTFGMDYSEGDDYQEEHMQ